MSVTYGQNQRNQWRHPVPFDESEAAQNLRSMPFWEYIHTWLANIRSRVSEDTWYSYYSNCARVVEYFQEMHPEVTLGTFSAQDIIEFDNYMSTVVSERTNQKLSSTYRRRLHGLISAAINEAMYQGMATCAVGLGCMGVVRLFRHRKRRVE